MNFGPSIITEISDYGTMLLHIVLIICVSIFVDACVSYLITVDGQFTFSYLPLEDGDRIWQHLKSSLIRIEKHYGEVNGLRGGQIGVS